MTEARQVSEWDHTAAILCKIHNLAASDKSETESDPCKFNPYRVAMARRITRRDEDTTADGGFATATIEDVIAAFVEEE